MRPLSLDYFLRHLSVAGFFMFAAATNAFANDSERINQLEKEVQELKVRLTKLESPQGAASSLQKPAISADGWKTLANWRALKTGMTPDEVRSTLGEPSRIRGGVLAIWYYTNRGEVTFSGDKVFGWQEPK